MAKFGRPLKELVITQTYHTGSNNTAVDFSAKTDEPVYAIADGRISFRSSKLGSYCVQEIDNSPIKVYYTHTYKWLEVGTRVKKGDIICYIAPTSLNGGHPTHLHLGLTVGYYLMDYMDRSLIFKTNYQSIKDIWFKGNNLNWSLFKDLSYNSNTMVLKIGDKIELSSETRLRKGAGTGFDEKVMVPKGAVGEIIGGPRNSQNEQFGKGKNDPYTWWDIKFLNNQGWMANVSDTGFIKTNRDITQTDGTYPAPTPPPTPPTPPPTPDPTIPYKETIVKLEAQIKDLSTQLTEKEEVIKRLNIQIEEQSTKHELELKELQNKYNTKVKECDAVSVERNRFENLYNQAKKDLDEAKELKGVSFSELVKEVFNRVFKLIKSSEKNE